MQSLFHQLISLLFPHRPTQTTLHAATSADLIELYHPIKTKSFVYLLPYQNSLVRACITETKFHYSTKAINMLAAILAGWLEQQPPALIIPIPLYATRQRKRGYNQVEIVARAALETAPLPHQLNTEILQRVKDTPPQTNLKRDGRLTNLESAFSCSDISHYYDQNIILIDDVVTTGATLSAAAAALRALSPRSLCCVALAH